MADRYQAVVPGRRITCFWTEDTGDAQWRLSRSRSQWERTGGGGLGRQLYPCPSPDNPRGSCFATHKIGRRPERRDPERGALAFIRPEEFGRDPRWPTACKYCGYRFGPFDNLDGVHRFDQPGHMSVDQEPIYRRPDTGEEWDSGELPPGAIFDTPWLGSRKGPDGLALTVVCPYSQMASSGFWHPDLPSTNSDRPWDRTGDPRNPASLTITPSILFTTTRFHAFLTNGVLWDC